MKMDIGGYLFLCLIGATVVDSICYSIEKAVRRKWQKRGIQRLKHFENKQRLIAEYAEFVALATAYATNTTNYCINCGQEELKND